MVLEHYNTKAPQLYVPKNPHSIIEGMPEDEGRAVISELWAHVNTQHNRYMAWSGENETMIWDAFGTTHTNPSIDATRRGRPGSSSSRARMN
jgi:alpha-ketoglutarate-dependent taurine dioxygenase